MRWRDHMLLVMAAVVATANPVAASADADTSTGAMARQFKADEVPATYVMALDGSGSVQEQGRLRKKIVDFVSQLQAQDDVVVLAFAGEPRLLYSGPARGLSAQRRRAMLTRKTPEPNETDIGEALARAVDELDVRLKRRQADPTRGKPVGALVLLTDGEIDAPATSDYGDDVHSGAWSDLRERLRQMASRYRVVAYAPPLPAVSGRRHHQRGESRSGESLLESVVHEDRVLQAGPGQRELRLDRLLEEANELKLRSALETARVNDVEVSVPREVAQVSTRPAKIELTIRSSIPVNMDKFTLQRGADLGVRLGSVQPEKLIVMPDRPVKVVVTLEREPARSATLGEQLRGAHKQGSVAVTADLHSPWSDELERRGSNLKLALVPEHANPKSQNAGPVPQGVNLDVEVAVAPRATSVAAAGLVVVALIAFGWHRRWPRLHGEVRAAGQHARLSGRRFRFGHGAGSRLRVPGTGSIRGIRSSSGLVLRIRYAADRSRLAETEECQEGQIVCLCGTYFEYTRDHRRGV